MSASRLPPPRVTPKSTAYVLTIGSLAAWGLVGETPGPILLAALLALPASLLALPGYYVAYGLLAQIHGANPSASSGSQTIAPDGSVVSTTTTGDPATWFTVSTHALGVLLFVAAAVANVLLVRALRSAHVDGQRRRADLGNPAHVENRGTASTSG